MKNTPIANFWPKKRELMYRNISIEQYTALDIPLSSHPLIYLYGNLGMWKTTLCQALLTRCTREEAVFSSPTYTYYNAYKDDIYHFDLYRLQDYEEFIHIWGEEILLNRRGCILVEWPELIEDFISPDIKIYIEEWIDHESRNLRLEFTPQYLS